MASGEKAILVLRQVILKQNRIEKTTFIAFVDIEKEFDNVKWIKMFNILEKAGDKYKYRRIIKSLGKQEVGIIRYENSQEEARIRK